MGRVWVCMWLTVHCAINNKRIEGNRVASTIMHQQNRKGIFLMRTHGVVVKILYYYYY